MNNEQDLVGLQKAPPNTPSDIALKAVKDIAAALNALLADVFTLYLKTKNSHWHMSGPHSRDFHLLLDEPSTSYANRTEFWRETRAKDTWLFRDWGPCEGCRSEFAFPTVVSKDRTTI